MNEFLLFVLLMMFILFCFGVFIVVACSDIVIRQLKVYKNRKNRQ